MIIKFIISKLTNKICTRLRNSCLRWVNQKRIVLGLLVLTSFCLYFYNVLVDFGTVLTVCCFPPPQSIPALFQLYLGALFYLVEENGIQPTCHHHVVSSTPRQSWNSNSEQGWQTLLCMVNVNLSTDFYIEQLAPTNIWLHFVHDLTNSYKLSCARFSHNIIPIPFAISVYLHSSCEFESRSWWSVIKFAIDLRQVSGFLLVLLFPRPIKLTATI